MKEPFKRISSKETATHVKEALEDAFPETLFSYYPEFEQLVVSWIDGPLKEDVERELLRFESYTYVKKNRYDHIEATGYEWKDSLYVGPRFILALRQQSERSGLFVRVTEKIIKIRKMKWKKK